LNRKRWFLPETPDVLGMLNDQAAITVEAMDALVAWAAGEHAAADRVRACEHRADDEKRRLLRALTDAFSVPLEPEDIFTLSMGIDEVLGGAKNTVREAEVMRAGPDRAIREMSERLAEGTRELAAAFSSLGERDATEEVTAAADRAIKCQRRLEHVYREAMSALIDDSDLREIAARRELYRRLARTSERIVSVAERIWYAVLKQT
jgi:uncharacterized protein Yka (UPF0111/DUF47 family)